MQHLIDRINRWQKKRVLVLGDYMLDQYIYGNAERLSPDAPVPVMAVEREESRPGGAANVCLDLRALRCEVICLGITGDDDTGDLLRQELRAKGCHADSLIPVKGRPTTVKRSFVGLAQHRHPQKMFRVDYEDKRPIDSATADRLLAAARSLLDQIDLICIEDYNKGTITEELSQALIDLARKHEIPVLVDPAAVKDYSKYRRATAITPSRTEAQLATGLAPDGPELVERMAKQLLDEVELDAVVLTLDRHGALLMERDGKPVQVPTVARNVYDVTGAGDMVLAMLAAALANGADWLEAVQLANVAAGLEVERFGVVAIPLEEIHYHLLMMQHDGLGKVRTLDQLLPELEAYRLQGRKIAFTNGCFDILHAGHVTYLRGARKTADVLVLAVNSDQSIRSLKGPARPIVPQEERLTVLSELECVNFVILFGDGSGGEGDTPKALLRAIRPDVLVKGGDYAHDEVVGYEIVEQYGGKVALIDPVKGLSTTNIVERIRSQMQQS